VCLKNINSKKQKQALKDLSALKYGSYFEMHKSQRAVGLQNVCVTDVLQLDDLLASINYVLHED